METTTTCAKLNGEDSGRSCDILIEEREAWGAVWTDSENSIQDTEGTMKWNSTEWARLEPLKWGAIQNVSRSFKEVTAIVDGWHPMHFGLLSEGVLRALASILNVIELLGMFPTSTQNLLVALIEKDSGHVPIGLFCALFRV